MPGFVRVTGASELAFPDYDGNGMFKSLGNLMVNPNVGLLFIALHDKPKRLRVNGSASVSETDPLLGETVGAQLIVRVASARHLPQLPALHPQHADDRAVDLHAAAEMRAAGAGLEELRQLQGRDASARANFQRLTMRSERFNFPNAKGEQLAATLDLPLGKPTAYALFAHCFTCGKDNLAAKRIAERLAMNGIAVLRFDFTGLGCSEGEFANTHFSSNVDDLVAAADHLRKMAGAPAILIGHSLGGCAVLAASHRIPDAAPW